MDNNKSQGKLCLLPEGTDQGWPALATPQLPAGFPSQVRKISRTEVGQGMAFEMAPDVFDRIEFQGVSRKVRQNHPALSAFNVPEANELKAEACSTTQSLDIRPKVSRAKRLR
jgi:hypothetical protein